MTEPSRPVLQMPTLLKAKHKHSQQCCIPTCTRCSTLSRSSASNHHRLHLSSLAQANTTSAMDGKQTRVVVFVALILLMLSAVFPPRMYTGSIKSINGSTHPTRTFLYAPHLYTMKWSDETAGVSISIGGMLAEWMLIVAGAGVVYLRLHGRPRTERDQDS